MRKFWAVPVLVAAAGLLAPPAAAFWGEDSGTVQASNLLEYQVGRDPSLEAEERTRLFDQFILDYTRSNLSLGLRYEFYQPSAEIPLFAQIPGFSTDYSLITQKYAQWSSPALTLRIGNGYAILGRGLLFRAFELPGVIRDQIPESGRYAESRDLDGVIVEGKVGRISYLGISGRPVTSPNTSYNPGTEFFPERRSGTISAGHLGLNLGRGVVLGGSYMRSDLNEEPQDLGGLDLSVHFGRLLPALREAGVKLRFYGEYAGKMWQPFTDGLNSDDGVPHAIYSVTELAYGSWGASFETKDYHLFNLLINDPPNLVPEFSARLLNRTTHVLDSQDEKGHQLSIAGGLPGGWIMTPIWAKATNRRDILGEFKDPQEYEQLFLGLESPATAKLRVSLLGSTGQDEAEGISDQWVVGGRVEYVRNDGWGGEIDLQYLQAERDAGNFGGIQEFENIYVSGGVSKAGIGSLVLVAEFSNDPLEKDDPLTFDVVEDESRTWLAVVGNLQIDANHEVTVFAGERRRGIACTSGTCYLVPDFSGVEVRLTSRF